MNNVTKIRITGENTYLNVRATGKMNFFLSDLSLTWHIFCWDTALSPHFVSPRGKARRAHQGTGQISIWPLAGCLGKGWDGITVASPLQREPRNRAGRCYLCVQVRLPHPGFSGASS